MINAKKTKCLIGILDLVYLPTSVRGDFVKRHTVAAKNVGINFSSVPIVKQIVGAVVNTVVKTGAQV